MVHDALLEGSGFHLSIATGYLDLWAVHEHGNFQLAILHQTLTSPDLEDACRFIRRQWPHARILVVRAGQDFLEDALYDDQLFPDVDREVLLATIKVLTATWHEGRSGNERS
jgi:DNA-binding response OmpR family regulator